MTKRVIFVQKLRKYGRFWVLLPVAVLRHLWRAHPWFLVVLGLLILAGCEAALCGMGK